MPHDNFTHQMINTLWNLFPTNQNLTTDNIQMRILSIPKFHFKPPLFQTNTVNKL